MMFKVKATLKAFLGDEEKYPCHITKSLVKRGVEGLENFQL
ncbi:MAG: hypothetical protein ABSB22_25865 [Thermodesulfobacteriota bacterium]|jgi:hypothetical protein